MRRWFGLLIVGGLLALGGPGGRAHGQVTSDDINRSIKRGVTWLRGHRLANGSWPYQAHSDGATALCVYALLVAGVPPDDPAVDAGIRYFTGFPPEHTYTVTLNILALTRADPSRYRKRITECAQYLARAQQQRAPASGMWTYTEQQANRGDNSNTQFAMLGLYEAMRAGVAVPRRVLAQADTHYTRSQNRNGGWGYTANAQPTGSMTAAGVASLHILGSSLYARPQVCGQYSYDRRIAAGVRWLADHFRVDQNPGGRHHFYYLYALERAGMLSGLKYFGSHDWYREGAEYLLGQQKASGSWGNGVTDTSFAVLFLAKGKIPVLINKLKWRGDWNNDRHDAEHLCDFVGEHFEQTVGWQVVRLQDGMSVLRQAPVLYFNGHGALTFTQAEKETLREYVNQGGFIFAEACCGRKPFHDSFLALAEELFPDRALEALPTNHPVWRSLFRISRRPPLMGIAMGCRTPIIYSPFDMSCAWEKMEAGASTEQAFQLGANICAYATGRQALPEKLDQEQAAEAEPDLPVQKELRGAFTFAQVTYGGDWDTGPYVGKRVMAHLRQAVGMTTSSTRKELALTDDDLFGYPFLFMSGRDRFRLSDEEKARLREYLERGGFLFAEAACGSPDFDASFRSLAAEVFPGQSLVRLPLDHPLFRACYSIDTVEYSPAVQEQRPGFNEPWLEAVTIDGRLVLVYSKYSLGYGIEEAPFLGSRGLTHDSALRVFSNVVVYAMTY